MGSVGRVQPITPIVPLRLPREGAAIPEPNYRLEWHTPGKPNSTQKKDFYALDDQGAKVWAARTLNVDFAHFTRQNFIKMGGHRLIRLSDNEVLMP